MLPSEDDGFPTFMFEELRHAAASDPKRARARLLQIIDGDNTTLARLLELMAAPSEGRLRQLVANTARAKKNDPRYVDSLVPTLIRWQATESDEFTRSAIAGALLGINLNAYARPRIADANPSTPPVQPDEGMFSEEAIAMYRWVAGRLCHRVRNRLDLPAALLDDAIYEASNINDVALRSLITKRLVETKQSFQKLSRVVEFNVDDDHFTWKPVPLITWIKRMTDRFKTTTRSFRLEVAGDSEVADLRIEATELLLETIFLNLWQNITQEMEGDCLARITPRVVGGDLRLLISDNGPGFRADLAADAFTSSVSTHGIERGRGLLEVADAVRRLRGSARLVDSEGSYRIELSFPMARPARGES